MKWELGVGAGVCPVYCKNPKGEAISCAGSHQQIKGCLYLYLTATHFFCFLSCGVFILACMFIWAHAHFNTLCIGWGGGVSPWGMLLSGAYIYVQRTWQCSRMTVFKSALLLALFYFLFPELQHHWRDAALIQSCVNPPPSATACPTGWHKPPHRPCQWSHAVHYREKSYLFEGGHSGWGASS